LKEVSIVAIEPEIKEILDDHGKSIVNLQIDNASIKEQLNSIKTEMTGVKEVVTDFKNNYLQSSNSMMGTLSTLLQNSSNNNTEIIKTSSNNKKDIAIKILAVIGVIASAYFTYKGIKG